MEDGGMQVSGVRCQVSGGNCPSGLFYNVAQDSLISELAKRLRIRSEIERKKGSV